LGEVRRGDLSDAARLQLFIDAVTDYAIFMLDPQGYVTSWNSGAQRIKGYAAKEIVGQHFSRFYPETDRAAGEPARALRTALESGRYEAEGWRIRKDGTPFWANVVIDPVRDPQGVLIGYAKVTRDITERRTAQVALQRAQEQLTHSQKMEALGQLTGGVAHDFNNLLMIVGDVLSKVFDPFFTTKGAGKGSGLGLSQVYGFARQSGGTATVDSELGKGARVTIYLPRSRAGILKAWPREEAVDPVNGGLVLLVEDNPVVAEVSATMLRELGFEVELASDANAALRAINGDAMFDLMFTDIVMAGQLDGIALARIVRQRRPNLPILLATGYSSAAIAARDEFSILRKPYQIAQLSRAIAGVVAQTRATNAGRDTAHRRETSTMAAIGPQDD